MPYYDVIWNPEPGGNVEQIAAELPDIQQRAQQHLLAARPRGVAIEHAMAMLKAERRKQGLSLEEMKARTGMERSTLSRLENQAEANPTVATLCKYAQAVGKKVLAVFADADAEPCQKERRVFPNIRPTPDAGAHPQRNAAACRIHGYKERAR